LNARPDDIDDQATHRAGVAIFLVCLLLGFITFFLFGLIFRSPDFPPSRVFPEIIKLLFTDKNWIAWLIILAFYFLVLLVRSIIWSVNTLRRH
jgi:Na+/proline symporter